MLLTSTYLCEDGYERLYVLPARELVKTRSVVVVAPRTVVVDVFSGGRRGCDVADPVDLPAWLTAEVTHDDRRDRD